MACAWVILLSSLLLLDAWLSVSIGLSLRGENRQVYMGVCLCAWIIILSTLIPRVHGHQWMLVHLLLGLLYSREG